MTKAEKAMRDSLTGVQAVFEPGLLRAKCDEMARLQAAGATRLCEGGVHWSVMLTDYDKLLQGDAQSLDDAFSDMARCLDLLADDHGEDTPVTCAVAPLEKEGDGK